MNKKSPKYNGVDVPQPEPLTTYSPPPSYRVRETSHPSEAVIPDLAVDPKSGVDTGESPKKKCDE